MPLRHSAGLPGAARGRIPGTWDAHREVRAAVLRFLAMGLVAVIVVSVPVAVWIRAVSKEYAVDTAQGVTQRLADYAVAPLATKALLAGESAALERLRQRLAPWLEDGAVEEIMVWDGRGRIVYSNVATHIGQRHALPVQGRDLEEGRTVAWEATPAHTNPAPHESHESHGNAQSLVGVFVGTTTRDGQPLVIEAYFDGESVKQEHADMVLGMAPAVLLALVVLQIAQLVPAVRLARRIQRHRLARQLLLQRALEASDTERKRIARNLHDDVIQELSGLAYALQAEGKDGPTPQRPLILQAGTMLQDNIHRLREMTSALYPSDLQELGLNKALVRLADQLTAQGTAVQLELDEDRVDPVQSALLYRFAREAVANVAKHARARVVRVVLAVDAGVVVLRIADDGVGFDPDAGSPAGHLGLTIMHDALSDGGGSLAIVSEHGAGTMLTATLPAY